MGPLGWPEMMFIFVLALVLFGPKKLPEIGRTVGKALTEFRRASAELKGTFEREMQSLEQDTQISTITSQLQYDSYSYDYSSDVPYEGSYGNEIQESTGTPATLSASATEGAESTTAVAPEGTIARGEEQATESHGTGESTGSTEPGEDRTAESTTSEHNA